MISSTDFATIVMFFTGIKNLFGRSKKNENGSHGLLTVLELLSQNNLLVREESGPQDDSMGIFYVHIGDRRFAAVKQPDISHSTTPVILGFLLAALLVIGSCYYASGRVLKNLKRSSNEMNEVHKRMDSLKLQLTRESELVAKMTVENKNLKAEVREHEEKHECYIQESNCKFNEQTIQIQELKAANKMLKDEADHLRQNLYNKDEKNKNLDELLQQRIQKELVFEQELRDREAKLESMTKSISELNRQLEIANACHTSAMEEADELRHQLQEKSEENETLKNWIQHFKDHMNALHRECLEKNQMICEMETKYHEVNHQAVEYRKKFEEKSQALDEAEKENQNSSNRIKCLEEQLRKVTKTLGEYKFTQEKAEERITELELELKKQQKNVEVFDEYSNKLKLQLAEMTECFNLVSNEIQQTYKKLARMN